MEGIIVINKPKGITSFDVIRKLRGILKEKRIGHTGTLDPLATGVLIICVGKATKLASDIEAKEKVYQAVFEVGYSTDTYDIEGKVLERKEIEFSNEMLEEVLNKFVGNIKQVPPMYSAIKVDGKKLYDLARKGIEIEREARDVKIDYIKVLKRAVNKVSIETKVSKGTYIRSLIHDIGLALGSYATMSELERISVSDCSLNDSYSLDEIEKMVECKDFSFIEKVENFFNFSNYYLSNEKEYILFKNGNTVKLNSREENGKYSVYYQNQFLGFATIENNVLLKGYKYF